MSTIREKNGTQYVAIADAVRENGGEVSWDNESKVANLKLGSMTAVVRMADENVEVNGHVRRLEAPPLVMDDTLFVPMEALRLFGVTLS